MNQHLLVHDFIDENWIIHKLLLYVPEHICEDIVNIFFIPSNQIRDNFFGGFSPDGEYSIKSRVSFQFKAWILVIFLKWNLIRFGNIISLLRLGFFFYENFVMMVFLLRIVYQLKISTLQQCILCNHHKVISIFSSFVTFFMILSSAFMMILIGLSSP